MSQRLSDHQPTPTTAVVVPSFNGLPLLKKNIKSWMKLLGAADELIIVDDASQDDSEAWLKDEFKLSAADKGRDQYGAYQVLRGQISPQAQMTVVINDANLRFAASCNRAVKISQSDLILLLNNDVIPDEDLLTVLKPHFNQADVFAVGCRETEPNLGDMAGGKNKLWFERGLFIHSRADNYDDGETAWVSGGSGIYDRDKWQQLGGFDVNYYPAYWEDIDLSFQAREKGWKVVFEPAAHVLHNHESTSQQVFDQAYLDKLGWVNGSYFTRKHSNWSQKLQFLLWRPYWWWQRLKSNYKRPVFRATLTVILLAAFLRLWQLGQVPAGLTWDEAAIGYNGQAVLQTRRDEWLHFLPVSFRSFGDYKAPLAIYLNGIFTFCFGLNPWAVRLPFAISGVLAVVGVMKLTQQLIYHLQLQLKPSNRWMMLASGLIMTLSPWHLQFTRTGFESGLALTFIIWGLWFVLRFLKKCQVVSVKKKMSLLVAAVTLLVAALYTYHSAKIFLPLLLVSGIIVFWRKIGSCYQSILSGVVLAALLAIPLIKDTFYGPGLTRAGTLIFGQGYSWWQVIQVYGQGLLAHLTPHFLIMGATDTLRHSPGAWAVLLPTTFILGLVAVGWWLVTTITKKQSDSHRSLRAAVALAVGWVIMGLTPAALGTILPQANRGLLALPGFIWLALLGGQIVVAYVSRLFATKKIWLLLLSVHIICFSFYVHYYYQTFAKISADAFNQGYLEAFSLAQDYEQGQHGKPEVNKIIFTSDYGQPYIYALFSKKTNPIWYRGGALIKYLFLDEINIGSLLEPNALIVASAQDELPVKKADHVIYDTAGQIRFKLYYTGN